MSFNWKEIVGSVAPMLGTALGGPLGGMAGKVIAESLGVKETEIEATIANAGPETLLALKEAENNFTLQMEDLGIKEEQLHAQDRASARERQTKTGDWTPSIIGPLIIAGFFWVLYMLINDSVPEGQNEAFLIMLGALAAMSTQVMNYFFGSSSGSKSKTQLLGKDNGQ